jgi:serine-type D-Ala-D-Ala carboxypeptidase (penicillin-binding protein 5/6)
MKKMTCIYGKNLDHKLEIASMTKIMTAYLVCVILETDLQCANINPKKVYFRASRFASRIGGTSAHIKEGLRYSIYDLLMGLILPSGNDAALVLAENFGRFLCLESSRTSIQTLKDSCEVDPYDIQTSKRYISRFVRRMNIEAGKLKLVHTCFSNPHGLSDKANKSSAQDVVRLSY